MIIFFIIWFKTYYSLDFYKDAENIEKAKEERWNIGIFNKINIKKYNYEYMY